MKITPVKGKDAEWHRFITATQTLAKWMWIGFWKHKTKREVMVLTTRWHILRMLWASGNSHGVRTWNIVKADAKSFNLMQYKKLHDD